MNRFGQRPDLKPTSAGTSSGHPRVSANARLNRCVDPTMSSAPTPNGPRGHPDYRDTYRPRDPRDSRDPRGPREHQPRQTSSANARINRCADPFFLPQEGRAPFQQNRQHWNVENQAQDSEAQPQYRQNPENAMATPRRESAWDLSHFATPPPPPNNNNDNNNNNNNGFAVDTRGGQVEIRRTNYQNLSWVRGGGYDVSVKRQRIYLSLEDVTQQRTTNRAGPPPALPPASVQNFEEELAMEEDIVVPTDPACICFRAPMKVCCTYCGTLVNDMRAARTCPVHAATHFLMDLSQCPNTRCGASAAALREYNL